MFLLFSSSSSFLVFICQKSRIAPKCDDEPLQNQMRFWILLLFASSHPLPLNPILSFSWQSPDPWRLRNKFSLFLKPHDDYMRSYHLHHSFWDDPSFPPSSWWSCGATESSSDVQKSFLLNLTRGDEDQIVVYQDKHSNSLLFHLFFGNYYYLSPSTKLTP